MGEYADAELAYRYPEVFGDGPRYRRPRYEPPVDRELPAIKIKGHTFRASTYGMISVVGPLARRGQYESRETITRTSNSRSFARGYPRELEEWRHRLTEEKMREQCEFWIAWRSGEGARP